MALLPDLDYLAEDGTLKIFIVWQGVVDWECETTVNYLDV